MPLTSVISTLSRVAEWDGGCNFAPDKRRSVSEAPILTLIDLKMVVEIGVEGLVIMPLEGPAVSCQSIPPGSGTRTKYLAFVEYSL